MNKSLADLFNRISNVLNKVSPTASQVHVDRPLGKDERVNKIMEDYATVLNLFDAIRNSKTEKEDKNNENKDKEADDKNVEGSNVYRGESF